MLGHRQIIVPSLRHKDRTDSALVMVEVGKAKLISTLPGDTGTLHIFETATGEYLSLTKPPLGDEQKKANEQLIRRILAEEG